MYKFFNNVFFSAVGIFTIITVSLCAFTIPETGTSTFDVKSFDEKLYVMPAPVVVVGTGQVNDTCYVKVIDGDGHFYTAQDNSMCSAVRNQIIKRFDQD